MTRYLTHIYDGNTDSDQLRMRTDAGGCRIFGFALVYLEAVAWPILTPISINHPINHPNTHTIYQPFRLGRLLPSFCLASLCSNLSSILQLMANSFSFFHRIAFLRPQFEEVYNNNSSHV